MTDQVSPRLDRSMPTDLERELFAALEALVRFCEQATDYEATHPFEFASFLAARVVLDEATKERALS